MIITPAFSSSSPILPGDLVNASSVNSRISNIENFINEIDTFTNLVVNSNTTLTANNILVYVDASGGNITLTLPLASTVTKQPLKIKKIDNSLNTVTINTVGSDKIEQKNSPLLSPIGTSYLLYAPDQLVGIFPSNSTTYRVVDEINNDSLFQCILAKSTAQSITNGVFVPVTFGVGTELLDPMGMHSTSSNTERVNILKKGIYEVNALFRYADSNTGSATRAILIYKNGTTSDGDMQSFFHNDGSNVGRGSPSINYKAAFDVGDYIEIRAYQESAGALNLNNARFSVELKNTL